MAVAQRLVPATFHDPIGLTVRLLQSCNPDAYFAMGAVALALVAAPLDRLLEPVEKRRYARARDPQRPIVLVTGAPRSGTTLLSQVLVAHLPVTYFNNLTALFPRAPIVANRLLRPVLRSRPRYTSYYGWTRGFATPGSCLHLWDRWMGPDRYRPPTHLDSAAVTAMRRFFGAWEEAAGRPILNKNNPLATCATLIAQALPTAHVIFSVRDPAFTVQSILGAREAIQGTRQRPYGVQDPAYADGHGEPIEQVCAQVAYHERMRAAQQRELGPRCTAVSYEAFCRAPHEIVVTVGRDVLGVRVDADRLRRALPPFRHTNRVTVPAAEFRRIEATLARLMPASQPTTASSTERECG